MAFTNPQSNISGVISNAIAMDLTWNQDCQVGQLLYCAARVATSSSTDPNITADTDRSPSGWLPAVPETRLSGLNVWTASFYRIATSLDTAGRELSITWTGSSTGTGGAEMIIAEFDGFVGTPTLDMTLGGSPPSAAVSGTLIDAVPVTFPELTIASLATANTSGGINTGTGSACQYTNNYPFSLIQQPSPSYLGLGWSQENDVPISAADLGWQFNWTNSRVFAILGATFYDPASLWQVGQVLI